MSKIIDIENSTKSLNKFYYKQWNFKNGLTWVNGSKRTFPLMLKILLSTILGSFNGYSIPIR